MKMMYTVVHRLLLFVKQGSLIHQVPRQPRRWPQGGPFDQQKDFMKMHHQRDPDRFFDAGSR
jgi:hypothetical protein